MDATHARRLGSAAWALGIALALALAGPCSAQGPASAWGGAATAAPGAAVIASSRPAVPPESRLAPPDDGLRLLVPARLASPVAKPVTIRLVPTGLVPASYAAPPLPPPVVAGGSALQLDVRGPARVLLGQPLCCKVRVRNAGKDALGQVRIVLPLPAGSQLVRAVPAAERGDEGLAWQLGNMLPGAEAILRVDLSPPDAPELRLCPVASFSAAAGLRTAIVRPPLVLAAHGPQKAIVGDKAAFVIRVTNNTPDTLRRVYLSCRLPAGLSHVQGQFIEAELPGELAPGQTREERLEARCDAPGEAKIHFAARADGGLTVSGGASLAVAEPALVLEVSGPRSGSVGQEMAYRLAVRNPGLGKVAASSLALTLPEGVELAKASEGGQFNSATQQVVWSLPALASQGRALATITVRGRKPGEWALSGLVTADGARAARHGCAVRVEQEPMLTMDLARMDDPLRVGEETTYEVRVYNQGPGSTAQVQVRFEVPANLLPVQGDGPSLGRIKGQTVAFDPVEKMPPKVDAMYKLRVRAVAPGSGRFRATTTAVGLPAPMAREITANVK